MVEVLGRPWGVDVDSGVRSKLIRKEAATPSVTSSNSEDYAYVDYPTRLFGNEPSIIDDSETSIGTDFGGGEFGGGGSGGSYDSGSDSGSYDSGSSDSSSFD